MRCRKEARPTGRNPVLGSAELQQTIGDADEKLEKHLDSTFGRLDDPNGRTPAGADPKV